MSNFYEEIYEYFINEGIEDEEATEVVNHLYDNNVHEHIVLTESKGKAILNVLRAIGHMSGILKTPGSKQALKATTKKLTGMAKPKLPSQLPSMQGALKANKAKAGDFVQPNFLTKKGQVNKYFTSELSPAQKANFGPNMIRKDPVPAASSALPQAAKKPVEASGQMRIPGMSDTAMALSRITGKPMGSKGGLGLTMSGGSNKFRNKTIFKAQPQRTAPSLPKPPASPAKGVDLKKAATVTGMSGLTAAAIGSVDKANKTSSERNAQRAEKLAQQRAETKAASQPRPEPTGERSAAANVKKQEAAKSTAQRRRDAAADFDKAFATARSAGKKEFTWRGKSYNTKLK